MSEDEPTQDNTENAIHGKTMPGSGRINALTDGVIAIAITLLALQFHVPDASSDVQLADQMRAMLPQFEMYIASFLMIGYFWNMHHTMFHLVERHDTALLWFNLLWLLPLTALPFATELVGSYRHEPVATAIYFSTLTIAAIFQAMLWLHARDDRYTVTLSKSDAWHMGFLVVVPLVVFGLGLALSWIVPELAQRVYLLIILAPLVRKAIAPIDEEIEKSKLSG